MMIRKLQILPLLVAPLAYGATITGNLRDITDARFTPASMVMFKPLSAPLQQGDGTTVLDYSRGAKITNGQFSISLVGGLYNADFGTGNNNKLIKILVPPNDTNTYTFNEAASFATNSVSFTYTNPAIPFAIQVRTQWGTNYSLVAGQGTTATNIAPNTSGANLNGIPTNAIDSTFYNLLTSIDGTSYTNLNGANLQAGSVGTNAANYPQWAGLIAAVAPPATPTTNSATLYVDLVNGTASGIRGRVDKPFDSLKTAVSNALSGDIILVGPGTNVICEVTIPAGVTVKGSGQSSTVFFHDEAHRTTNFYSGLTISPVIGLSDNATLEACKIITTNTSGATVSVSIGSTGGTNMTLRRVDVDGYSDVAMFRNLPANPVSITWLDSDIVTHWDCIAGSPGSGYNSTNDVFTFVRCRFTGAKVDVNNGESVAVNTLGTWNVQNCIFDFDYSKGLFSFAFSNTVNWVDSVIVKNWAKTAHTNTSAFISGPGGKLNIYGKLDASWITATCPVAWLSSSSPTNTPTAGQVLTASASGAYWATVTTPTNIAGVTFSNATMFSTSTNVILVNAPTSSSYLAGTYGQISATGYTNAASDNYAITNFGGCWHLFKVYGVGSNRSYFTNSTPSGGVWQYDYTQVGDIPYSYYPPLVSGTAGGSFVGNAGGATNLNALYLRATNAPAAGNALRFDGTNFYWAN